MSIGRRIDHENTLHLYNSTSFSSKEKQSGYDGTCLESQQRSKQRQAEHCERVKPVWNTHCVPGQANLQRGPVEDQQLKAHAHAALPEDLGSIPSTNIVVHKHL